ncbi:MAG: aldo/keto reductase [Verrucomicrobiia bacterium]|jgi:predicted aldo/keto reductase-like oxidoreductase
MKRRSFLKVMGGVGAAALGIKPALVSEAEAAAAKTGEMHKRVLGRTGFKVSVVGFSGLGLMHYDQERCNAEVHKAFERGLNYYDVAPAYGKDGDCETKMSVALQGLDRSRYFLACKSKKRDAAGCREELERSLQRLKTDYFDVYQMHHLVKPEDVKTSLSPGGALEMMLQAKKEGKIRAIGFSAHTTKAALAALRGFAFDTVMFPVNYVEYYTRGFAKDVLALAKEKGAVVLSIKTINSGAWPKGAERTRKWWYRPLEQQDDINLAYRWTLSLPGVVMGFPPGWMDLQEKAIGAGIAYRPATEADAKKLETMAKDCGSIFKREEDLVASAHMPYPHHPHECCEGEWA